MVIKDILLLLTDPRRYWDGLKKRDPSKYSSEEIQRKLFKVLLRNPKELDDFFIVPKEPPKNVPGVIMANKFAELFLEQQKISEEVPIEIVTSIDERAKKEEGLPNDFNPCEEVMRYLQYLLIVDDKIKIDNNLLKETTRLVDRAKSNLIWPKDTILGESSEGLFTTRPYLAKGCSIWLNEIISTKILTKVITVPFDYVLYSKELKRLEIVNIINYNVVEFPEYYKKNRLDLLCGFQAHVIPKNFANSIEISFLVIENDRTYQFRVKNIPDSSKLLDSVRSAIKVLEYNSRLPVEYLEGVCL